MLMRRTVNLKSHASIEMINTFNRVYTSIEMRIVYRKKRHAIRILDEVNARRGARIEDEIAAKAAMCA